MRLTLSILLALCWSLPAQAVPRVVVSVSPVHSLVAGVMDGIGEPELLIPASASPHAYALKPSDARALSQADLVVWVGEDLEMVLEQPLHSLAGNAQVLELSTLKDMHMLSTRKGGVWEAEAADESGHEGHGHAHALGEVDMHLWLAPENARRIVSAVADKLATMDAVNASRYRANAQSVARRITALEEKLQRQLAPLHDRPYIVFHDAYHYFEEVFSLHPAGAISISPDRRPGARRLTEIRAAIKTRGAACVFSEPQFRPATVNVVVEGTGARSGVLDPLGANLAPGKTQWFVLMQQLADNLTACLGQAD